MKVRQFVVLFALVACARKSNPAVSYPITASVIVFDSVDSSTGLAQFKVEDRKFSSLTDINTLSGADLQVSEGGDLAATFIGGDYILAPEFTGATKPQLRYVVANGVVVPRDYKTLALLSTYYQFETLFDQVEKKFGLTVPDILSEAPDHKLQVFFEPTMSYQDNDLVGTQAKKLNAAYLPSLRKFAIFRTSAAEQIPLSANLQVIGHEFGHTIFEHVFYKGSFDENDRYQNEWAMRGLNEGFADFSSYTFTGSTDILRASIPYRALADERDFSLLSFSYENLGAADVEITYCAGGFYCEGTLFARSLYILKDELAKQNLVAADDFAKMLTSALASSLDDMKKIELPARKSTADEGAKRDIGYDGRVIGAFLDSLVANLPQNVQNVACEVFSSSSNFGTQGYPIDMRQHCQASQ